MQAPAVIRITLTMNNAIRLPFVLSFFAFLVACSVSGSEAEIKQLQDKLNEASNDPDADFAAIVDEARAGGVTEAFILQATTLERLGQRDIDGAIVTLDKLIKVANDLEFGPEEQFLSKRQLKGFASSLKAIQAYQSDNYEAFEKHAASAFLDAPDYVDAFGILGLVTELRASEARELAMADLRIPMEMAFANVDGESKSLKDWMGGNQALLIDFWASWCGPCIHLMPELRTKAETLPDQGVFVAGMNTDRGDQVSKAKKVQDQHDMQSVPWLLEPENAPLSSLLMINSIPRMILVDAEGKVLYNGHPMDPGLKKALAKLDVTLPEKS